MDAAASAIVVYRPVVRRNEERYVQGDGTPAFFVSPGAVLGWSRFSAGAWRACPELVQRFGVRPAYTDRGALLDALARSAHIRGIPILIRSSRRAAVAGMAFGEGRISGAVEGSSTGGLEGRE